jgi:hypothetical protein
LNRLAFPKSDRVERRALVLLVAVLMLLNSWTFAAAIPETTSADGGCCASNEILAKDFSAFYVSAWRLFHDPSQIYYHGNLNDGESAILPEPQGYKYFPSFLIMVSPFLLLPYHQSLLAFDFFQFLLLPFIAWMIYLLLKGRGVLPISAVSVAVLILPLPLATPQWVLSAGYYWQWAEGQSKVLETFLMLGALVLAKSNRPRWSGVVFGLASFDPRFLLLGLPLFMAYSKNLKESIAYAAVTFALSNIVLINPPTLLGFLSMAFATGDLTPPYYYTLIPIVALASLLLLDRERVKLAIRRIRPTLRGTTQDDF